MAILLSTAAIGAARAAELTAIHPGVMCQHPDALALLTLPDGSSRTSQPGASAAEFNAKTAGGCVDLQNGDTVSVLQAHHNTSQVQFAGRLGAPAGVYVIPNVDFASVPASGESAESPPVAGPIANGSPAAAPSQAAIPGVGAASTPAPGVGQPAVSTPAPSEAYAFPRDTDYASLVVALAKQSPALLDDPAVQRYWALHRDAEQYERLQNQEFALQPLLAQARADLAATASATPAGTITVLISGQFGTYDFQHGMFPLTIGGDQLTLRQQPCCVQAPALPEAVAIDLPGLDAVQGWKMDPSAAQELETRLTRFGAVDRRVTLAVTVKLDPSAIRPAQYGVAGTPGALVSLDVVSDERQPALIQHFSGTDLAQLRSLQLVQQAQAAAAAARARQQAQAQAAAQQRASEAAFATQQAAANRAQIAAERSQLLVQIDREPLASRLSRALGTLPGLAGGGGLDNLRGARAEALMSRGAVPVRMLVEADGNGRVAVPTRWPGHLALSVPTGGDALAEGRWYLVAGLLQLSPGEDLPSALLTVSQMIPCQRDQCTDQAEPGAIVDRMLAAASSP